MAKQTPFGGTIAHGFLTLSLLSKMIEGNGVIPENTVMGINYGFEKVRFLAPVFLGDTVTVQYAITRLELERRTWLRLGRDVVGQRTTVAVAKNRYGPPGQSVDLDIHYLNEGERSLATHRLIADEATGEPEPAAFGPRPVETPAPQLVVV